MQSSRSSLPMISDYKGDVSKIRMKSGEDFQLNPATFSMITGREWKEKNIVCAGQEPYLKLMAPKIRRKHGKRKKLKDETDFKGCLDAFNNKLEQSSKLHLGVERIIGKKHKELLLALIKDPTFDFNPQTHDIEQGDQYLKECIEK